MTGKTEAIILRVQKKGDNNSLVYAYTRAYGRSAYTIYGNKWKSTLQPMALVEISSQHNPTREIENLTSVERTYVPKHQDVPHYCMSMFMAEVVEKSLKHPMEDETLFDWLREAIKELDQRDELNGFIDEFLMGLSTLLGYGGTILDEWRELKSLDIIQTIQ